MAGASPTPMRGVSQTLARPRIRRRPPGCRTRFHVRTSLVHAIETAMVRPGADPEEVQVTFHGR